LGIEHENVDTRVQCSTLRTPSQLNNIDCSRAIYLNLEATPFQQSRFLFNM